MQTYQIDLNTLIPEGHIVTELAEHMLYLSATKRLSTNFDKENMSADSFIAVKDTFKLPLRIDLTVKMDSPGLFLFIGKGHINFGTLHSDNRRIDDILEPNCKPRSFHNHIPMNEFNDISVLYGLNSMQILINGEERFYSEKEKYMKSKILNEYNDKGFKLKIAGTKRTNLVIKALQITEYDVLHEIIHKGDSLPEPITINAAIGTKQKPDLEDCISLLPEEIREEIRKTDFMLRSIKPLKFKRQIEKNGNKITYLASDYGFSYLIFPSNDVMNHYLSWYIITSGKPETWHRKDDKMEMTLNKLKENSPGLAERLFLNLSECIGCCQCIVKTPYVFNGNKKITCHGKMEFKMSVSDFEDIRTFIKTINELI